MRARAGETLESATQNAVCLGLPRSVLMGRRVLVSRMSLYVCILLRTPATAQTALSVGTHHRTRSTPVVRCIPTDNAYTSRPVLSASVHSNAESSSRVGIATIDPSQRHADRRQACSAEVEHGGVGSTVWASAMGRQSNPALCDVALARRAPTRRPTGRSPSECLRETMAGMDPCTGVWECQCVWPEPAGLC
jgi:hypothetical protein